MIDQRDIIKKSNRKKKWVIGILMSSSNTDE